MDKKVCHRESCDREGTIPFHRMFHTLVTFVACSEEHVGGASDPLLLAQMERRVKIERHLRDNVYRPEVDCRGSRRSDVCPDCGCRMSFGSSRCNLCWSPLAEEGNHRRLMQVALNIRA